jgi:hypothetical protein
MQRNIRIAMALGIVLAAFEGGVARAAIPSEFTVQGVLRDNTGTLASMMVMVTLNFFDAQTAGNQLNGSAYGPTAVMATNGLFTDTITLTAPDLTAIAGASAAFLQIQVGSDTYPRQKVEPAMYALLSQNATQLGGVPASSYLTTTAANAAYAPASGSANYAPASGSANYAPASGSANYAPATGSTHYAPATGSTAYAPVSGSANYAPATGSTAYEPRISWPNGNACPSYQFLYGVNPANGTPSCDYGTVINVGTGLSGLDYNGTPSATIQTQGTLSLKPLTLHSGSSSTSLAGGGSYSALANCASGSVESGECTSSTHGNGTVFLVNSHSSGTNQWACDYYTTSNQTGLGQIITAYANCR